MFLYLLVSQSIITAYANYSKIDKAQLCATLDCDSGISSKVCGMRKEGEGYRLKIFQNQCDLLKYGCKVDSNEAYGLINVEYCDQSFPNENIDQYQIETVEINSNNNPQTHCDDICEQTNKTCGIRRDGEGFKISLFDSECGMLKHNCINRVNYTKAFLALCDNIDGYELDKGDANREEHGVNEKYDSDTREDSGYNESNNLYDEKSMINVRDNGIPKNIVVVNTPLNGNINDTIDAFFAATHMTKIPISEIPLEDQVTNETSRRMLLKYAGPVTVFKPWVTIPKDIKEDDAHSPTLASCYHKCPEKCPETYAPVCGVPGIVAREPSLMFRNHCYMDRAQCKMYNEEKSPTARSSAYVESAFLFCLGDEITGLYRFLPLVRTLQHMGRLKRRGRFRYRLRNLRFFNSLLSREPNVMG